MKKRFLLILVLNYIAIQINAQSFEYFTDKRDGKIYKTVKIEDQTWMAENLKYKPINGEQYFVYNDKEELVEKLGYLYPLATAKESCPEGWHLPTYQEYEVLIKSLQSQSNAKYTDLIKGGKSGFECELAGYRDANSRYIYRLEDGVYWCATYNDMGKQMTFWIGGAKSSYGFHYDLYGRLALSIRCVKD